MNIYRRWNGLWSFLALNAVRRRAPELWLDFIPHIESLNWLTERLAEWLPRPEFYYDYGLIHYDLFEQFKKKHGLDAGAGLVAWRDYVFVKAGSDRVSEWYWSRIMIHADSDLLLMKLSPELTCRVEKLHAELRSNYNALNMRMTVNKDEITDTEKPILAAFCPEIKEGPVSISSLETLSNSLNPIAVSNHFILAWHRVMSDASIEQLRELYTAGKEAVKQMPGGADPMMLGFPGTWPSLLIVQRRFR